MVVVGLLVMLYWCLGGGCAAFLFIWSRLRKKIGDLGLFFFFPPIVDWWPMVVVVVVVVVVVANGRGGCDWCYGCFFG